VAVVVLLLPEGTVYLMAQPLVLAALVTQCPLLMETWVAQTLLFFRVWLIFVLVAAAVQMVVERREREARLVRVAVVHRAGLPLVVFRLVPVVAVLALVLALAVQVKAVLSLWSTQFSRSITR
jgi:hypothetical protein